MADKWWHTVTIRRAATISDDAGKRGSVTELVIVGYPEDKQVALAV
ncbi:hypothetical protein LCGC14_1296770 [marine sediment metagenome]|uniref:Uncharacterized protein n=1 Tax=marine sediment metagenome TaxID=412755 RepID=A0A0F9KR13_9ZZZZ